MVFVIEPFRSEGREQNQQEGGWISTALPVRFLSLVFAVQSSSLWHYPGTLTMIVG